MMDVSTFGILAQLQLYLYCVKQYRLNDMKYEAADEPHYMKRPLNPARGDGFYIAFIRYLKI